MTISFVHRLTPREEEVLKLAAKGFTNVQIALELEISPKTVATYMSRIYTKLGVSNRTSAAVAYLLINGHDEKQIAVSQSM